MGFSKLSSLTPLERPQARAPKGNKMQAAIVFLAAHPVLDDWPLAIDLTNEEVMTIAAQKEWKMCFYSAYRSTTRERKENL